MCTRNNFQRTMRSDEDEYESMDDRSSRTSTDEDEYESTDHRSSRTSTDEDECESMDDRSSRTSTDEDDSYSRFRSRRKRRRNRISESFQGERDRKMAREKQMKLLQQKRARRLNRIESSSEDEGIVEFEKSIESQGELSSDGSEIVTPKKRKIKRQIQSDVSDESENDHPHQSQYPNKKIESEDDEIYTHNGSQRHYTRSDEEMSWEEAKKEQEKLFDSTKTEENTSECTNNNKLVLDYDVRTRQELITVHPKLAEKLKPHQIEGVTFMWKTCFESVKKLEKERGSGCILAHCMGLGKTLQVITLCHTILTHENTQVKSILVLCPVSTILNWVSEFEMWLSGFGDKKIKIYNLTKLKKVEMRLESLETWTRNGGVMIIGYDLFRLLCNKKMSKDLRKRILRTLLHPGCDLVVCDEAHVLKNDKSALTKTVMKIRTRRRILLTGTPLQNNLMEFYCMVRFAKPNLLGSKRNFQNHFGHVITKGQFRDSKDLDVSAMKQCAYVLTKISANIIQRRDHETLKTYLPIKREFVIIVSLSDIQANLYEHYLEKRSMIASSYKKKHMKLLGDYAVMRLIWTHPLSLRLKEESDLRTQQRKRKSRTSSITDEEESDGSESYNSEPDDSATTTSSEEDRSSITHEEESDRSESHDSKPDADPIVRRRLRFVSSDEESQQVVRKKLYRRIRIESSDDENEEIESRGLQRVGIRDDVRTFDDDELAMHDSGGETSGEEDQPWWRQFLSDEDAEDYDTGPKVSLLFAILKECEQMDEKVLVFSQSLASLNVIEHFLEKSDKFAESLSQDFVGEWHKGVDYFRLDGKTSKEHRAKFCNLFNDRDNKRARLFLISTKAGGLGINLTAANRVVIFDNSWNPSSDIQSIFRIYRFGQTKSCFVYRFVSQATMEEKIFERQITKLSIARRIIDEEQIDRHFTREEVGDLYAFNRVIPTFNDALAKKSFGDGIMARLVKKFPHFIINVHEHDSFLVKNEDEELTEEERRKADEEFGLPPDEGDTRVDVKEKIRSALEHIGVSSNTDSASSETDVNELLQKLKEFYKEKRKEQLNWFHGGAGGTNPFKKSIPTDERDQRNGAPSSNYHDRRRPIFGMAINKVRESMRDPERLLIEQRALLHMLREQSNIDANQASSSKGPPRQPVTWVLTCPGKDAAHLEGVFRSEFPHWWSLPIFGKVGAHLLLHFKIRICRDTLDNVLGKHGIKVDFINPDLETAQSLLGPSYSGCRDDGGAQTSAENDDRDDSDESSGVDSNDDDYDGDEYDEDYVSNYESEDEWPSHQPQYFDEDQTRKLTKSFIL